MAQQLLKLSRNLLILLVILFVLDRAIGYGLERLFYAQQHGDDHVSIYLLEHANDSIIVMGSSRASHHYNSQVLHAGTGMTCFNGGRDEMTITYGNAVLPIVYQRYRPKVVILDIGPSELTDAKDRSIVYQRVATVLLPFLHRHPSLRPTIALAGSGELYKAAASHIYPYNSSIGSSIQNAYTHMGHLSVQGYEPLIGHIDSATYRTPVMDFDVPGPLSPQLVSTFTNIITTARQAGIRLIVVMSPFYFPMRHIQNNGSYQAIRRILQQQGVECYDFLNAPPFSQNPYLFYDEVHLNDSGATLYSKMIVDVINKKK